MTGLWQRDDVLVNFNARRHWAGEVERSDERNDRGAPRGRACQVTLAT